MKLRALRRKLARRRTAFRRYDSHAVGHCTCNPVVPKGTTLAECWEFAGPHHEKRCTKYRDDHECTCGPYRGKNDQLDPNNPHEPKCFRRRVYTGEEDEYDPFDPTMNPPTP